MNKTQPILICSLLPYCLQQRVPQFFHTSCKKECKFALKLNSSESKTQIFRINPMLSIQNAPFVIKYGTMVYFKDIWHLYTEGDLCWSKIFLRVDINSEKLVIEFSD